MRSIQDCLSRRLWKFKRKMEDNFINVSGTHCKCAIIDVIMDKYQNTCQSVNLSGFCDVVMDFPDDDIPTSTMNSNTSYNTQSNVIHMYDLLPISAYFKNEDIRHAFINIKRHNGADTYAYILNVYEDFYT